MATKFTDTIFAQLPDISGVSGKPTVSNEGFYPGVLGTVMSGNSEADRKLVRQYNGKLLRLKTHLADLTNSTVSLPTGTVEIHLDENDTTLAVSSGSTVRIKGQGRDTSILKLFPVVHSGHFNLIDTETLSTLTLEELTIDGISNVRFETIKEVTAVDSTTLDLSAAVAYQGGAVRAGALAVAVNKKAWIIIDGNHISDGELGRDVKAQEVTITAYGADQFTITALQDNHPSSGNTYPLTDYTDPAAKLIVAFEFDEDTSESDYTTYGEYWQHVDYGKVLISHQPGQSNTEVSTINLTNCRLKNFENVVNRSGGACTLNLEDGIMEHNQTAITFFSGDTQSNAHLNFNDASGTQSYFQNNGLLIIGTAKINQAYVTADGRLGSGIYAHPNVQHDIRKVTFQNNDAGALRFYSASSGNTAAGGWTGNIQDCTFTNNAEYDLYCSREMPTTISGCSFDGDIGNIGYSSTWTNNSFSDSHIYGDDQGQKSDLKNPTTPAWPIPVENQADQFDVVFDGNTFTGDCRFDCVWYGMAKYCNWIWRDNDWEFTEALNFFFGGSAGAFGTVLMQMEFQGVNRLIDNGAPLGARVWFLTMVNLFKLTIPTGTLIFDTVAGAGDFSNFTDGLSGLFRHPYNDPSPTDDTGRWYVGDPVTQPEYNPGIPEVVIGDQSSLDIPANIHIVYDQHRDNTVITFGGAITNPDP